MTEPLKQPTAGEQEWPTSPSDTALHFVARTHSKYFKALNAVEKMFLIKDLAGLLEQDRALRPPAGVDTVGHTDVTVEELVEFLLPRLHRWDADENNSSIDVAQAIIDQFNVTRK